MEKKKKSCVVKQNRNGKLGKRKMAKQDHMVKLQLLMLYSSFIGTFLVNMYISDLESPLYILQGSKTVQDY